MSGGEIVVLAFIVAAFVIFGVTLAWISHGDATERPVKPAPRKSPKEAPSATSYQGADG